MLFLSKFLDVLKKTEGTVSAKMAETIAAKKAKIESAWSDSFFSGGPDTAHQSNASNEDKPHPTMKNTMKHKKSEMNLARDALQLNFPSFSSLLPYRYFDSDTQLFINEQSLGLCFELAPLTGADEKTIQGIADLLRFKIPDDVDLQFILWGSHTVGHLIEKASLDARRDGLFGFLRAITCQYYKKAAVSGFTNRRGLPLYPRDMRLFCFISKKTPYTEHAVHDLLELRSSFEAELKALSIHTIRLDAGSFLSLLRAWVNPDLTDIAPAFSEVDAYETLNEQIPHRFFELRVDEQSLEVASHLQASRHKKSELKKNKKNTQVINVSIKKRPKKFALWMTPDNFFNVFRASQALSCPFLISWHLRLVPSETAKNMAQTRYFGLDKKARSVYAKYVSGTTETAQEWKKLRDALHADEVRLAKTFFNLVLFSTPDHVKRDEAQAVACLRQNGFETFTMRYTQLQSYLATLPFVMSEGMYTDLQRARRLMTFTTGNMANLLPLVSDYKVGTQGVLTTTLRNQIACLNFFDEVLPTTNFNIAVAASSGAGKSFLVQTLLFNVLSRHGQCWVIDIGQSYRKFCESVGGVYLDASTLKLNPFTHVKDIQEDAEKIRDLLAVLASPTEALSAVQEENIREAVLHAWETKHNQACIDDVVNHLDQIHREKQDNRIGDVITLLKRYTREGTYARMFNESSLLAPDASFVVLELGGLESSPHLLRAVLFALMLSIEERMYRSERFIPKMVVIDEAWRLLSGDHQSAARFIEKGFRTVRRHNGAFCTITQSIKDYHVSKEAEACWSSSDIKIIMRQNALAFQEFLDEHPTYFTPFTERLLRQLGEARHNGYSEFMVQIGQVQSFHRLFVDPFSRVMFSSSGADYEAVMRRVKQGATMAEAILEVAKTNYADELMDMNEINEITGIKETKEREESYVHEA